VLPSSASCGGKSEQPRGGTGAVGGGGAAGSSAGSGGAPIAGSGGSTGGGSGHDATGGAAGTAGQGGGATAGVAGDTASGSGGVADSGGSAGASANAGAAGLSASAEECATAADCTMTSDCCGCRSEPGSSPTTCPLRCARDACAEEGITESELGCVFGRCVFMRACDTTSSCAGPPESCPEGLLQSFGTACSGPACVAPTDCLSVGGCESCGDAFCVEFQAMTSSFSCVERVPACDSDNYCECLGVCGTCTESDDRVTCPCLGC
jgi:hypothetical protein